MARNQEKTCRNWVDLPQDLTVPILSRLGAIEILETAQMVCKTWHRICKDPTMWRTIDMSLTWRTVYLCDTWIQGDSSESWENDSRKMEGMCRHAVNLGRGDLVDISLENFGSDDLLCDIIISSKQIRRLRLVLPNISCRLLNTVAPELPLLEDLELSHSAYTTKDLEVIGRHCPLLKSLKLNKHHDIEQIWMTDATMHRHFQVFGNHEENDDALAIAGTMRGLQQLQIVGNKLTNTGLLAILDGCPCLESLDLRRCFNLKVEGDLERRCFQRIIQLRLPHDSMDDYELVAADEIVYKLYQSFTSHVWY